jgi:hypothetical protein
MSASRNGSSGQQSTADGTALVDERALCGDPPDTSSGINIDAVAITSHGRYLAFSAYC